jgi:hypothetical protein
MSPANDFRMRIIPVWLWFVLIPLVSVADYQEADTYRSVLDRHYIKAGGTGTVDVSFRDAVMLFEQENLLNDVQAAYAKMLTEGQTPEFTIQVDATNQWSYVNKSGQQSVIIELHRLIGAEDRASLVYYSAGERFFGKFRAVIVIDVIPAEHASSYEVTVYAYPENSFSRFFARHLGVVDRFFHAKTLEITALAVGICEHMLVKKDDVALSTGD